MEKLIKKMRKSRRKMKSKQITELSKKEMEMEDMLSSSEDMSEESKITDKNNGTGINECNLPFQIGLGGVIIKGNGEPLELTTSAKWDSNYDDTNSLVSLVLMIGKFRVS